MPFLPGFWEKIKSCFAAIAGFFKDMAGKFSGQGLLGRFSRFLRENTHIAAKTLLGKIPEKKRRMILMCGAGSLVLLVFAGVWLKNTGKEPQTAKGNSVSRRVVIPSEEIFLPEEPDFVPGILLERERRASWTAADAAPFWQDPLKDGEERWRERVEAVIDEFLEHVP